MPVRTQSAHAARRSLRQSSIPGDASDLLLAIATNSDLLGVVGFCAVGLLLTAAVLSFEPHFGDVFLLN